MKRILFLIPIISLLFISHLYVNDNRRKYLDTPYFNVLPNDSISKIFNIFGKSEIIETEFSHNYVLYYDYQNRIGLIVCIYQLDGKSIWYIKITKDDSKNAIDNLHGIASLNLSKDEGRNLSSPQSVTLPDKLTKHGLRFGMSQKEVEKALNTKLSIEGEEAEIGWQTKSEGEVYDYGTLVFAFKDGKLISLSWFGVDP